MHLVLQRAYEIRPKRHTQLDFAAHFAAVSAALLEEVRAWLGAPEPLEVTPSDFPQLPRLQWHEGDRSVSATSWRDTRPQGMALLELELRDRDVAAESVATEGEGAHHVAAHITLRLGGAPHTGLWLHETQRIEDPRLAVPAPTLAPALHPFDLYDRDGRITGVRLTVTERDKARLIENLRADRDKRSLPVVIVSYAADGKPLIDAQPLAERLVGIARVACTKPNFRWSKEEFAHLAFNGAVRLYSAGLRDEDTWNTHPYKKDDDIERMGEQAVLDWATQWAFDQCLRLEWRAPGVDAAIETREKLLQAGREADQRAQWEKRVKAAREDGARITLDEFDRLLEEARVYTNKVEAERDELRAEIATLREENRGLRYRANQVWLVGGEEIPADAGPSGVLQVVLSTQACATWLSLDEGLLKQVSERVFAKLADVEHLESNVEQVESISGQCLVYPRRRSASGMRAILQRAGNEVRVLEVFHNHDRYEEFRNALNRAPLDPARYESDGFVPWTSQTAPTYEMENQE